MKRNITVKEQNLIDRLNEKRTHVGVDLGKEGGDKTEKFLYDTKEQKVVAKWNNGDNRWDNNGPIQFEEQKNDTLHEAYDKAVAAEVKHALEGGEDTRLRTHKEQVNHPDHYNDYDVEVIEMMERVFGHEAVINFCRLNAFKYRMRAGHKDGNSLEQDLKKERWYLDYIKNHK